MTERPSSSARQTEDATIQSRARQTFLRTRKEFKRASVHLEDDALVFVMEPGPGVSGGIPVPQVLVNWVARNDDPVPRLASRLPNPVEVGRISIAGDGIRVSIDGRASPSAAGRAAGRRGAGAPPSEASDQKDARGESMSGGGASGGGANGR